MALDLRDAFALGRDEKHITSMNAADVALAAIQGLKNEELEAIKRNVAELRELEDRLASSQKDSPSPNPIQSS